MERKLSILLSGGGLFGSTEIGALESFKDLADSCLFDLNENISCVYGSSIGALNAAAFVQYIVDSNLNPYWMSRVYENIDLSYLFDCPGFDYQKSLISNNNCSLFIQSLIKNGAFSLDMLKSLIDNTIDINLIQEAKPDLGIVLSRSGFKNILSMQYDLYDKNKINGNYSEVIASSCAFPFVFENGIVDGKKYIDGGVANSVPINEVINDDMFVIDLPVIKNAAILNLAKFRKKYNLIILATFPDGTSKIYKRIGNISHQNLFIYRPQYLNGSIFNPEFISENINRGKHDIETSFDLIKRYVFKA